MPRFAVVDVTCMEPGKVALLGNDITGDCLRALQIATHDSCAAAQVKGVVFFDFAHISYMGPKFFLDTAHHFLRRVKVSGGPTPILANLNSSFRMDLDFGLRASPQCTAIWECDIEAHEAPVNFRVSGMMRDAPSSDLLAMAYGSAGFTAHELAHEQRDWLVSPSGWSNRLSHLWSIGLLARFKRGREMVYHVPWLTPEGAP